MVKDCDNIFTHVYVRGTLEECLQHEEFVFFLIFIFTSVKLLSLTSLFYTHTNDRESLLKAELGFSSYAPTSLLLM